MEWKVHFPRAVYRHCLFWHFLKFKKSSLIYDLKRDLATLFLPGYFYTQFASSGSLLIPKERAAGEWPNESESTLRRG